MNKLRNMLATLAALGLSTVALADDHYLKAEIDDLSARITPAGTEWNISVAYEVEVRTRQSPADLALVLQLEYNRQLLFTEDNRPFEVVVLLDRPSEVDDDELTFEGSLSFSVPANQVTHYRDLRIIGQVYPDPQSPALDRDDARVKLVDGIEVAHSYVPTQPVQVDERFIEPAPQPVQPAPQPVYEVQPEPVYTQPAVVPAYAQPAVVPVYTQPVVTQHYVTPVAVYQPRPSLNIGFGFSNYGYRGSRFCPPDRFRSGYHRSTVIRTGSRPILRSAPRPIVRSAPRTVVTRRSASVRPLGSRIRSILRKR